MAISGNGVFAAVIKGEVVLGLASLLLYKNRRKGKDKGRWPCEGRGRDWSEVATSQGMHGASRSRGILFGAFTETRFCPHLDLRLLSSAWGEDGCVRPLGVGCVAVARDPHTEGQSGSPLDRV
jgi:hypothetical protein